MSQEKRWINKYLTEDIAEDDISSQVDELDFVTDELLKALVMDKKAIAQVKTIKREIKKLQRMV